MLQRQTSVGNGQNLVEVNENLIDADIQKLRQAERITFSNGYHSIILTYKIHEYVYKKMQKPPKIDTEI